MAVVFLRRVEILILTYLLWATLLDLETPLFLILVYCIVCIVV